MDINIGTAQKLTSPNPFALLSTLRPDGGTNLMAVSWWTYVSNHPPMIAVALSKKGWSGELIEKMGEFCLNIVDKSLKDAAFFCGTVTGRAVDKAAEKDIGLCPADFIKPMLVQKSRVSLECRLKNVVDAADHNLFLAEIVAAHYDETAEQLYAWEGYKRLDAVE